jgi:hypothetical protein
VAEDHLHLLDGGPACDEGRGKKVPHGSVCVFDTLETPQSIIAAVDSTTAAMGVQLADDGDLHYSGSYHPDNGLNMVITDQ